MSASISLLCFALSPDVVIDSIESVKNLAKTRHELSQKNDPFCGDAFKEIRMVEKECVKEQRKLDKKIENITREEFGFCKVGEGNIGESILANIIQMIFVKQKIIRNIRPKILKGLEIDIFYPK
jgi:myosin-crossreactive antigen